MGAAVLFAFLFGYFVMLLWTWLIPELFGPGVINYWKEEGEEAFNKYVEQKRSEKQDKQG
ncbi:MAG: hypothetical protein IIB05_03535 [Bacteroidetes bacterium]|nr:hypothetical protein [Bacteroidota bacterium]